MDDFISRQAAIDALHAKISEINEALWELEGCQGYCDMVSSIGTVLDDIPSAQPEPSQIASDIATIIENEKDMRVIAVQPEIMSDGTLHVTADTDISTIGRVLVSQSGTSFGNLYYGDDVPSAQPERKTGKWIEIPDTTFASTFRCSVCGKSPLVECGEYALTNFCPNCGADMRGEEHETD